MRAISQLDEAGEHSDILGQINIVGGWLNYPSGITNMLSAAKELQRLASNLKD
jgi:hypothetical protein